MKRAIAIALCVGTGCVELPQEEDLPAFADAAAPAELAFDGGLRRPPTGRPYTGPQCSPSSPAADGGPQLPPSAFGDGGPFLDFDGGGDRPAEPGMDAAVMAPVLPRPTQPGDIVITEIMVDPMATRDDAGEWIELWNARETEALSVEGCLLDDGATAPRQLSVLVIEPRSAVTIARSAAAGFSPDLIASFTLTNTSDTVAVLCDGVEIDRVRYDGSFGIRSGASLSLDPAAYSAEANDHPEAWCPGALEYAGDRGTPGELNPSCSPETMVDGGVL